MSKRVHFVPTTIKVTAEEIAFLFFDRIVSQHGLPQVIVSDRDAKFLSLFWKNLFQLMGTKLKMSTSHHPQTDGQTERMNRVLEEMLRGFVNYTQNDWDLFLPAAEFSYNSMEQESTGHTPFFLDTGRQPLSPLDMVAAPTDTADMKDVPAVTGFLRRQKAALQDATQRLKIAQENQKVQADKRRSDLSFHVGNKSCYLPRICMIQGISKGPAGS